MVILVVDDEKSQRENVGDLLRADHEVHLAEDGQKALEILEKIAIDLVITDNQMPRVTGLELIKRGKILSPTTSFIIMTAFGSVEQAVEAIHLGAEDYLMKPFDLSELELRVKKADELRAWGLQSKLKNQASENHPYLIGNSENIQAARIFISQVAKAKTPVLLLGPTGSGKEVMARTIHETSACSTRSFVPINCASLNEELVQSELFGHERGAFTGATATKQGRFELASGGTIFLDEIGELTLPLQAKLLRVLQEKEFSHLGGTRVIKMDARIIAATHRNLEEMVKAGTFREDLFFRLNVLSFELKPLWDRSEDIPELIEHFWSRLGHEHGGNSPLPPQVRALLEGYHYPGNIRELQNILERLAVLSTGPGGITSQLLPSEFHPENEAVRKAGASATLAQLQRLGFAKTIELLEAQLLEKALIQTGFNQMKTAVALQLDRSTLRYKIKKYGLSSPRGELSTDDEAA